MTLDERLRERLRPHGAADKRMFGGTCFLIGGNMLIGTLKDGLIVRVGKAAHAAALKRPGARTFDMTGRPMEGFVAVDGKAIADDAALQGWIRSRPRLRPHPATEAGEGGKAANVEERQDAARFIEMMEMGMGRASTAPRSL